MATLGRWKQSRRRGVFIRRALSMTLASQRRIAKRAGVKFWSVAGVQRREKIRPPQLSAAIGYTASGKTRSEVKKSKQKNVLHFSESEKKALLEKYSPLIKGIAFQWWKSGIVKKEFGNFEQFLYDINCFVSEKLDYYNPSIVGKSGRQLAVSSWMRKAATIFCMRVHVDRQRKLARYDRLNAAEPLVARSWIPFGAKRFLKKLGMNLETVADAGFDDIREMILKIAKAEETRLTEKEKAVVRMGLEGKTLQEIAHRLGLKSKGSIHPLEGNAAAKIKTQIRKLL